MILAEEFDRCDKCGDGWFEIKKMVLVQKGSPGMNPMHHKVKYDYVCNGCGHRQYTADTQPDE